MFNDKHYVPVLRWKRAEWVALRELNPNIRGFITPLIEIPSAKFKDIKNEKISPTAKKMYDSISCSWDNSPFFLDVGHLTSSHCAIAEKLLKDICTVFKNAIPIIALNYPKSMISLIASLSTNYSSGVCLRLKKDDIFSTEAIKEIVKFNGLNHANIDLIIDLEMIDDKHLSFLDICSQIPNLYQWRTFTIIGGSFPQYLTGISPGQHRFPRKEWLMWKKEVTNNKLPRKPTFGDFTIQYPYYREPPLIPNATASIRYAANNYWIIMRGETLKKKGRKQWNANAVLLSEHQEFCGKNFSYGDRYIFDKGHLKDTTGSLETWLRAGINHHLTFVARQIANFSAS